ncbi:hypothetical protein F5Y18DRAFT_427855 [Xylariaceae sp. FL1019]|nr:hypothetical protein F5Y18DRAFT_427855 [Xylariaceae sp. FL1019]
MKIINGLADQLKNAQTEIQELKKENAQLKEQLRRQGATPGAEVTSPLTRRLTRPPLLTTPGYAQATTSSLAKHQSPEPGKRPVPPSKSVVIIQNGKYHYENCVPVSMEPGHEDDKASLPTCPNYMSLTSAAYSRKSETKSRMIEYNEEKKFTLEQRMAPRPTLPPLPPSPTAWSPSYWSSEPSSTVIDWTSNSTISFERDLRRAEAERSQQMEERHNSRYNVPNLDAFSRIDEDWDKNDTFSSLKYPDNPFIDSARGFQFLRRAMVLVQEAMFPLFKKYCSVYSDSAGPFLLRLGRSELLNAVSDYAQHWLGINGHTSTEVYIALMEMPELRNAVAHPTADELSSPIKIDRCLKNAQKLAFIFRDFHRTMEIRTMRDNLVADISRSDKILGNICGLAITPFSENMELDEHFRDIFRQALDPPHPGIDVLHEGAQSLCSRSTLPEFH